MSFLLDTCVVSEATKERRDLGVQSWVERAQQEALFFSAITLGELKFGVDRLGQGVKRGRLEAWLAGFIADTAPERILPIDSRVALIWASLRLYDPNIKLADGQIAATALAHGLTLITRNVREFPFSGLAVFNPWSK